MWLTLRIAACRDVARDIRVYELEKPDGGALPGFSAGAHVKVRLPDDRTRRYSLADDPARTDRYRIAVLHEASGTGGSQFIHESWKPGDLVDVEAPQNHFPFADTARDVVLVAGGIGITPILAMAHACRGRAIPFRLIYLASTPDAAAFADEVTALVPPETLVLALNGRASLAGGLAAAIGDYRTGRHVYVCGPAGLIHAVREAARDWPHDAVRFESFAVAEPAAAHAVGDGAFEVVLAASGRSFSVGPDITILDVLERNGIKPPSLCREGYCGTCLVGVLEGTPDHRDTVLTEEERSANTEIALCCSRARGPRLVIDL